MRTIKFRGKDIKTGKWLYGNIQAPSKEDVGYFMWDCDHNQKEVIPYTVGQFTGLYDKNSKKIYEGDILIWGENEYKSKPLIVCFKHGSFGYIYCDWFHSFAGNRNFTFNPLNTDVCFEIIGNIHDNPELLKGGKE